MVQDTDASINNKENFSSNTFVLTPFVLCFKHIHLCVAIEVFLLLSLCFIQSNIFFFK